MEKNGLYKILIMTCQTIHGITIIPKLIKFMENCIQVNH